MERERNVSHDLVARTDNYTCTLGSISLLKERQVHIPTPPLGRDQTRRTRVEKAPLPPTGPTLRDNF